MNEALILQKSKAFALRIIRLYQYLKSEKLECVISKQVLRSGTSIGANVAEAEYGISRSDFLAKMYIALKECAETLYWLELLRESDYLDDKAYRSLLEDGEELRRMLSAITKSTRKNSSLLTRHS